MKLGSHTSLVFCTHMSALDGSMRGHVSFIDGLARLMEAWSIMPGASWPKLMEFIDRRADVGAHPTWIARALQTMRAVQSGWHPRQSYTVFAPPLPDSPILLLGVPRYSVMETLALLPPASPVDVSLYTPRTPQERPLVQLTFQSPDAKTRWVDMLLSYCEPRTARGNKALTRLLSALETEDLSRGLLLAAAAGLWQLLTAGTISHEDPEARTLWPGALSLDHPRWESHYRLLPILLRGLHKSELTLAPASGGTVLAFLCPVGHCAELVPTEDELPGGQLASLLKWWKDAASQPRLALSAEHYIYKTEAVSTDESLHSKRARVERRFPKGSMAAVLTTTAAMRNWTPDAGSSSLPWPLAPGVPVEHSKDQRERTLTDMFTVASFPGAIPYVTWRETDMASGASTPRFSDIQVEGKDPFQSLDNYLAIDTGVIPAALGRRPPIRWKPGINALLVPQLRRWIAAVTKSVVASPATSKWMLSRRGWRALIVRLLVFCYSAERAEYLKHLAPPTPTEHGSMFNVLARGAPRPSQL